MKSQWRRIATIKLRISLHFNWIIAQIIHIEFRRIFAAFSPINSTYRTKSESFSKKHSDKNSTSIPIWKSYDLTKEIQFKILVEFVWYNQRIPILIFVCSCESCENTMKFIEKVRSWKKIASSDCMYVCVRVIHFLCLRFYRSELIVYASWTFIHKKKNEISSGNNKNIQYTSTFLRWTAYVK